MARDRAVFFEGSSVNGVRIDFVSDVFVSAKCSPLSNSRSRQTTRQKGTMTQLPRIFQILARKVLHSILKSE